MTANASASALLLFFGVILAWQRQRAEAQPFVTLYPSTHLAELRTTQWMILEGNILRGCDVSVHSVIHVAHM